MLTPEEIEKFNQRKYEHDYTVAQVSIDKDLSPEDYFRKLVQIKLGFIRAYGAGKRVLDVGCGNGDYLFEVKDMVSFGYGIDYTDKAIDVANSKKKMMSASHLEFIKTNAKQLPFEDGAFDLVFSFAALAYIPKLEEVINGISRVLRPSGVAILEMGNRMSLNTIVCDAHPEWARTCHIRIKDMKRMIGDSQLKILEWRAFQILPFWGERPGWLRPLLHPGWKKFLQRELNGKMLDEWLSNVFCLRPFAYRHFIFCRKE